MNDRYNLSQFYKGKEFEIPYTNIQRYDYPTVNSENIYIVCLHPTHPRVGSKKEKEKINQWLNTFKNLDKVNRLKINVYNQEIFDSVCEIPNLTELYIEGSDISNIEEVLKLKKLKRLLIRCSDKLTDIKCLSHLKLSHLMIEECFNIANYGVIGKIKTLKGLSLNGNWTNPKKLKLPSLKPFENLNELRHLDLSYSTVVDKSFESILKLNKLERFDTLSYIKKATRQKIKENHKSLKAGFFMDWDYENKEFYENKNW